MVFGLGDLIAFVVIGGLCTAGLLASRKVWRAETEAAYAARLRQALPWLGETGLLRAMRALPAIVTAMISLTIGTLAAFVGASEAGITVEAIRIGGIIIFVAGFGIFIVAMSLATTAAFIGRPSWVIPPPLRDT